MSQRSRRAAAAQRKATQDAQPQQARDGFQNLQARLGVGANNMTDASTYTLGNPITRRPRDLEAMYRQSWVVGAAVDAIADDMTRAGVDFGSAVTPDQSEVIVGQANDLMLWDSIGDVIRWSRLYGGAIGVILIDGQDMATALRHDTIAKDSFRGVHALGRWELVPSVDDSLGRGVRELGPNLGKPDHYDVGPNASALQGLKIHHSRVIRLEGVRLPYFQRVAEQGWGMSIVERMFDRLLAFDSSTTGAAQLVFKAYLRTIKINGLRQILAAGGAAEEALAKNVEAIRRFQSTEGLTLIDGEDDFQTNSYSFAGLDSVLLQFGQQLSGATGIPLVRLFGQSPAGLNSTGESDIRNYYDGINAQQERYLRSPLNRVLDILHRSSTGHAPADSFGFKFNPLWQLGDKEKSEIAKSVAEAVVGAYDSAVLSKATALKELKQSADVTGIFSNISDEDIAEAENDIDLTGENDPDLTAAMNLGAETKDPLLAAGDAVPTFSVHGLRLVIETAKGEIRRGRDWSVTMPEHYGYIAETFGADNDEVDCFLGPNPESERAWVIDQRRPDTGTFDEHKVMIGFVSQADALNCYLRAYDDGLAFARIGGITEMSMQDLKAWLAAGRAVVPVAQAA